MSGGSQHNPNGRQAAQLGAGWSPLQLQVANFLARAPQAHLSSERGVTWHTPTPPPHLYHVPVPSPPDPLQAVLQLQAMKGAGAVFRHSVTPPDLYRHTPTPPDKHLLRHTPSPGDVKAAPVLPPADLYPHLGPAREKPRPEEPCLPARGVDLSLSGARNGAPPALSVRDVTTVNSLVARSQPRAERRVDALLERLGPPSVIVRPRAPPHTPTPSPPSSNEDSADSCGAPPGSKRKRKPERTIRLGAPPILPPPLENGDSPHDKQNGPEEIEESKETPQEPPSQEPAPQELAPRELAPRELAPRELAPQELAPRELAPRELAPQEPAPQELAPQELQREHTEPTPQRAEASPKPPSSPEPHARRKTRSNSAETIDDIAAMIASSTNEPVEPPKPLEPEPDAPVTIDKLESVLASDDTPEKVKQSPKPEDKELTPEPLVEAAAAPKRRSARTSNSESTNVPVESPSEAKPAEPETEARSAEPVAASFVEVENQLEKMFAGIEEQPSEEKREEKLSKPRKRRKSAPTKGESKAGRRKCRASTGDERRKGVRKKSVGRIKKTKEVKDAYAYDSGSNASSSRSRGPYIQIRGPRDSPLSVSVINASTGEEEGETGLIRRKGGEDFRNGLRARGLHASTLGLRYDATTPDATWLCVFCQRGPHAAGLGDLFGPYTVDTDCEEYRALDEATRRRYEGAHEVWFHASCAVWAPGLIAAGARLWGLAGAVWGARGARCAACGRAGAALACQTHACRARAHLPCAAGWRLDEENFHAICPRHA